MEVIKMRKALFTLSLAFLMIIISGVSVYAADPIRGDAADSVGPRNVVYDHWSLLNVKETITDLGGGTWKYSYEFTNTDVDGIWHFGVWSHFGTSFPTIFVEKGDWYASGLSIEEVIPPYDARNLDPDIVWVTSTWGPNWPYSTNPIVVGEHVSGFSFTANVYDPSPKYYFYELQGSYAGESGIISAVGLTGEPGSINGYVKDIETGTPLRALVIAINAETKDKSIAITNANGYYEISDLAPGIYWVLAIKRGYKVGIKRAEVVAGEETTVNFELSPKPE
jgi:hypothetical protein